MKWYNKNSKIFLERGYLKKNQPIQEKIKEIGDLAEKILNKKGFSDKLQDYIQKGYYIIPTPLWTNFYEGSKSSAISCFGLFVDDTIESILDGVSEAGMQSKIGGGTSGYFGNIRPRGSSISNGGITSGPVHFMELYQTNSNVISQANRRGHFSATLPVYHPDIMEFLDIRSEGHPIQDLSFSVSIPDWWIEELLNGDKEKEKIWARIIEVRFNTGFPYIFFSDNVNNNTVEVYKDKGYIINNSNMCQEIALPNSNEESFICCLLGMNIEKFDEWKDTDAVEVAIYLMDATLTDFIDKNKNKAYMSRSVRFAERHRAVGLGASGYHSYLQSKMIPFESMDAKMENVKVFKLLKKQSYAASEKMAKEYGKPEVLKENKYKRRHTCLLAIAPNTSSSFIVGQQSQSIEPYVSNYYIKDVAKTKITVKNPYLKEILKEKGKDTEEIWVSILRKSGSVQHLDFLTEIEKNVFKTFSEISQLEIIIQASQRQQFIDQSQSLNIMVPFGTDPNDVSYLMLKAHQLGIKTLYYQLNVNAAQEFTNSILECASCAG